MEEVDQLFDRLSNSKFRKSFKLKPKELQYLKDKGMETVMGHALDFVGTRIAPSDPPNDGKQTPYRNHPVFVAQHATATCCRGCIEKWHKFPRGRRLEENEIKYILGVIKKWLERQLENAKS